MKTKYTVINSLNASAKAELSSFIERVAKEPGSWDLQACENEMLKKDWDYSDPKCSCVFELSARDSKYGAAHSISFKIGDFETHEEEL